MKPQWKEVIDGQDIPDFTRYEPQQQAGPKDFEHFMDEGCQSFADITQNIPKSRTSKHTAKWIVPSLLKVLKMTK